MVGGLAVVFNIDRPETRQLARYLTSPGFGRAYSATGLTVAANQRVRGSIVDFYPPETGELADLVDSALDAGTLRPWPLADPSVPWEMVNNLNEATADWLSAGPAVLESVLARVEAEWQAWESQQNG